MEASAVVERSKKRVFTGQVVSDKMDKTVVVLVSSRKVHRLYKKYVTFSKRLKVHDEKNDAHVGDTIQCVECRPISKQKCWRLTKIVERAK